MESSFKSISKKIYIIIMTVKVICCVSIFTVMADEKAETIGQTAE